MTALTPDYTFPEVKNRNDDVARFLEIVDDVRQAFDQMSYEQQTGALEYLTRRYGE